MKEPLRIIYSETLGIGQTSRCIVEGHMVTTDLDNKNSSRLSNLNYGKIRRAADFLKENSRMTPETEIDTESEIATKRWNPTRFGVKLTIRENGEPFRYLLIHDAELVNSVAAEIFPSAPQFNTPPQLTEITNILDKYLKPTNH